MTTRTIPHIQVGAVLLLATALTLAACSGPETNGANPLPVVPAITTGPAADPPAVTSKPNETPSVHFANCADARAADAAPLHRGDPGYREELDRDHDGIACE